MTPPDDCFSPDDFNNKFESLLILPFMNGLHGIVKEPKFGFDCLIGKTKHQFFVELVKSLTPTINHLMKTL